MKRLLYIGAACASRHPTLNAVRGISNSSSRFAKVGFIGLGHMGRPMAVNLACKTDNDVTVYDVRDDVISEVVDEGSRGGGKIDGAKSCSQASEGKDVVITMLPSNPHVKQVYLGDDGVLSSVRPGTLLIDCSTIDPAVCKQVASEAVNKRADYMDAPVSGGVLAAKDAKLTFMVGGTRFEDAKKYLAHMGGNVIHCGDEVGTGEAAKICNNMLLAISMIGTSEAMHLGIKLGLDPALLAKVLNTSSGRCWSSEVYNPCPGVLPNAPSSRDFEGGFGTALMTKDLMLSQSAASSHGCATPLGSLSYQLYKLMCLHGYESKDFSVAFKFLCDHDELCSPQG